MKLGFLLQERKTEKGTFFFLYKTSSCFSLPLPPWYLSGSHVNPFFNPQHYYAKECGITTDTLWIISRCQFNKMGIRSHITCAQRSECEKRARICKGSLRIGCGRKRDTLSHEIRNRNYFRIKLQTSCHSLHNGDFRSAHTLPKPELISPLESCTTYISTLLRY